MQKKHRVTGRGKEVAAWVSADGEVACCVHAQEAVGEVALHCGAEVVECVGVVDECGHVGV